MPKYREKSAPRNAHQLSNEPWPEWMIAHYLRGHIVRDGTGKVYVKEWKPECVHYIHTMVEGYDNDWIIENKDGSVRRISNKLFAQLYERVAD